MEQIQKWFEENKIIAVIRSSSPEDAESMIKAAMDGGVHLFEISMQTSQALRIIESFSKKDTLLFGAGSVNDGEMAQRAINSGAKFLSSDYTDKDVINVAKHNDVFVIQGATTPTEAVNAHQLGADLIKIYPAALAGGPNYLRTLRASFPFIKFAAAGGVAFEDAFEYLKNCVAVSLGKAIFDKSLVRANSWSEIAERAKQFTRKLDSLKVSK